MLKFVGGWKHKDLEASANEDVSVEKQSGMGGKCSGERQSSRWGPTVGWKKHGIRDSPTWISKTSTDGMYYDGVTAIEIQKAVIEKFHIVSLHHPSGIPVRVLTPLRLFVR